MNTDSNRRLARRIKEIWERTGVMPLMRLPRPGPLLEWFRRNLGEVISRGNLQTVAMRVLGQVAPREALVLANVSMQARHGSGVLLEASMTYATGALAIAEAKRLADGLRDRGVEARVTPVAPGLDDAWVRKHLLRRHRHDGVTDPMVFTSTNSLVERMKGFGLFPNAIRSEQLVGDLPLPEGVVFTGRSPSRMDAAPPRRNELTFRPPVFA